MSFFISKLMNANVQDSSNIPVGRLVDLIVEQVGQNLTVVGYVVRRNRKLFLLPEGIMQTLTPYVRLRQPSNDLSREPVPEDAIQLIRDVLDAQVIDINGAKVIRVNDIQMEWVDGRLIVLGLDIGAWGLCRRLGLAKALAVVSDLFNLEIPEGLIRWSGVAPVEAHFHHLTLQVPREGLRGLHPADLAEIVEDLGHTGRQQLLATMSVETMADVVEESEPAVQLAILKDLGEDKAADVLDAMEPDEAADLLAEVPEDDRTRLMQLMEPTGAQRVRGLMAWKDETAGARMNTNFVALAPELSAGEAITRLRSGISLYEDVPNLYVVDEATQHFHGMVSLRRLLSAHDSTPLLDLLYPHSHQVRPEDPETEAAELMTHYKLLAVPVVNDEERILGVVTIYDIMDQVFEEVEDYESPGEGCLVAWPDQRGDSLYEDPVPLKAPAR